MVGIDETVRRLAARLTHRIQSLPVLALTVHTACNCRCVMCDIWTANARGREISGEELDRHLAAIRRLRVQRVMLTGGEPLLHANLWRFCARLRELDVRISLVTTGLLIGAHAADIAAYVDEVVVSIDGPPEVHDAIRRVRGGFEKIERGLVQLARTRVRPRVTVRSVVQHLNCSRLLDTVRSARGLAVDRLSFLAADVSSPAFNRPLPWSEARQAEVALSLGELPVLAASIRAVEQHCARDVTGGFVVGGGAALWRIHAHYGALLGQQAWPPTTCNAPWVSAVLEPDGQLRPCFFHQPYLQPGDGNLETSLNHPRAIAFRRRLDVNRDETCRRCVCTLNVLPWAEV
jgi:MoaA/NifB/PqqE/SkfB family radical SAM enzyme